MRAVKNRRDFGADSTGFYFIFRLGNLSVFRTPLNQPAPPLWATRAPRLAGDNRSQYPAARPVGEARRPIYGFHLNSGRGLTSQQGGKN